MWLPFLCFAAGSAAAVGAVTARLLERRKRAAWQRTTGEVVRVDREKQPPTSTRYLHVVSFKTDSGELIELPPATSTKFPYYKVGQAAPVLFNPASPKEAVIDVVGWRWGQTVWWFIAAAFALTFLGGVLLQGY